MDAPSNKTLVRVISCAQWLPKSTNFGELQGSFGGEVGRYFLLFRGFQAVEPKAEQ